MVGTYASLAVILAAAAVVGQGLFALCGRREWSWLAPAVGLGALVSACWCAVNLGGAPGWGLAALLALTAAFGAAAWAGRPSASGGDVAWVGVAVLAGALLLASLPFFVEGRLGILGTSLNPDMSQHLFAADRLVHGGEERLISEGYPLGPHALVVSVAALGPSLVEGFGGLTLAIALAAALAPLAVLDRLAPGRRVAAALLVGFAYMASSYLIQGSFKETMQALFVLAFAIGLHQIAAGGMPNRRRRRLIAALPLAALAAGSVYAYSFPGLAWLAGALGVWALAELVVARDLAPLRAAVAPAALALGALGLAIAPELGRIADFASFETFNPDGAGLGNLFNPISPLEALGIWPSGDFRLDPGAGAAPAAAYWLGGLVALAALGFGLRWWLRRGERAVPAALAAAALLYLYALIAGTPYQESKAIAIAAPLAMLVSVRALFAAAPRVDLTREGGGLRRLSGREGAVGALAIAFAGAAAGCGVLALANGPVGPDDWNPGLVELRHSSDLGPGGEEGESTLILAPDELLVGERGEDLYLWELRGGRVCAAPLGDRGPAPPPGISHVITVEPAGGGAPGRPEPAPPFDGLERDRIVGPYVLWEVSEPAPASDPPCPFIADGDRADPGA